MGALNDCVSAYFPNLALHPLLRNLYRENAQFRAAGRVFDDLIKQTNKPYDFDWMGPIFARFPESISHITDPIYIFIRKDLVKTLSTIYKTNIPYLFKSAFRARIFLNKVLIPERRYVEAENIRLYLGAWAFVHISFVMIAMLHAIFSQYFYLPFLTYSVELHVGKRPKKSIYSGGYTAWQDDFVFYNIKFRDTLRLWWGFLGRGTKK